MKHYFTFDDGIYESHSEQFGKPIPHHEYSNCSFYGDFKKGYLKSYNTKIILFNNYWITCTGTYSKTTIKHIGLFCNSFLKDYNIDYYFIKNLYLNNEKYNLKTGEIVKL